MSSSASQSHIEVVAPDNGGRETLWVVISVSVILVLAFIGISINRAPPTEEAQHTELSIEAKRVLTDLRNAADEISFSSEDSDFPDITELESWELPPFAKTPGVISQYIWSQLENHCYLGVSQQEGNPTFMLLFENKANIYWNPEVTGITDCHLNSDWIEDKPHA